MAFSEAAHAADYLMVAFSLEVNPIAFLEYARVVQVTDLPLYASLIAQVALVSDAVLVIELEVAHGIIQSGRYSPNAEKMVETCLPSTKSEKTDEVGVAEYLPIVHIIELSVIVTTGLSLGSIGATCESPVKVEVPD